MARDITNTLLSPLLSAPMAPAGTKRSHDGIPTNDQRTRNMTADQSSQFTSIFENFRDHLDEHYDRRERIIKTSRDITALSKKMYCSLYTSWTHANLVEFLHSNGTHQRSQAKVQSNETQASEN